MFHLLHYNLRENIKIRKSEEVKNTCVTSLVNISVMSRQIDFHLQWWLFNNQDNNSHDSMLLPNSSNTKVYSVANAGGDMSPVSRV